jgi:hypothetical protein
MKSISENEKYTFLNFSLDILYVCRSLFYLKFLDALDKSKFISLKVIDYSFYNMMLYIRNRYDSGDYRPNDIDYSNKSYVPDSRRRPYPDLVIGTKPTNYTDFVFIMVKLIWWDLIGCIQLNPVLCLVLYIIYHYFPLLSLLIYFGVGLYVVYNLFDK